MEDREKILNLVKKKSEITAKEIAEIFDISRQAAHNKLSELVKDGLLVKVGLTRATYYTLPDLFFDKSDALVIRLKNRGLQEDQVLEDIQKRMPKLLELPDNVRQIFNYAFLEMLNNAIEHSGSDRIEISLGIMNRSINFVIRDYGVGVFRKIMKNRKLNSELEAIGELSKGKTTTAKHQHSGEGIFFTSKTADRFRLSSFGHELLVDNTIPDLFVFTDRENIKGTRVDFSINLQSKRDKLSVFREFEIDDDDRGFGKTKIHVKLFRHGSEFLSRSQARRVTAGLEKFRHVIFDFDKVLTVGQAFADEVFRVFQNQHPEIEIEFLNANKAVQFMIERVEKSR